MLSSGDCSGKKKKKLYSLFDKNFCLSRNKIILRTDITHTLSEKKSTKAVTGAVPFQKVNFCPFQELKCPF